MMPLTRPSLFLRLHSPNNTTSWQEFAATYSGVITDYARVYGRCGHDQNDIVQNVWLVLCRIMPKFQYQPDRGGFRHLLRRIVKTTAIDWIRRQGLVRTANVEVMQLASLSWFSGKWNSVRLVLVG